MASRRVSGKGAKLYHHANGSEERFLVSESGNRMAAEWARVMTYACKRINRVHFKSCMIEDLVAIRQRWFVSLIRPSQAKHGIG